MCVVENITNKWVHGERTHIRPFKETTICGLRNYVPNFVGRCEKLKEIHEALQCEYNNSVITAVICGFGGIGKTELAVAYANMFRVKYGAIIWIHAKSHKELVDSFLRVAKDRRYNIDKNA